MVKFLFSALLLLLSVNFIVAQELSYGFKAGLNFSHFNTTDIEQSNGEDLESFTQNSGFHLGIIVNSKLTELFGARAEILFSQKGGRYEFEGPSYAVLNSFIGEERIFSTGIRSMNLNTSNTYIDIPVSVYFRPASWLEISAGPNVGLLISSIASGELSFQEISQSEDDAYRGISLDYRYFSDEPGEFEEANGTEIRMINGQSLEIPKTINAYYDYPDGFETGLYNRLDFGVHAGLSFFINKSLFVGARVNVGLTDITDSEVDRALQELDDNDEFILRDDNDRNFSIQASIGFSF